jgi:hypothetical protein
LSASARAFRAVLETARTNGLGAPAPGKPRPGRQARSHRAINGMES